MNRMVMVDDARPRVILKIWVNIEVLRPKSSRKRVLQQLVRAARQYEK